MDATGVGAFAPAAGSRRIEALDVVRGFALLGIFLMNIEWFNRPFHSFDEGLPRGLTGADWLASWFIGYFVQGKFWTIFSLLFGMGFAVMLTRAEQVGRAFRTAYLRRILGLAVFGALHYIFIWEGDILFSYAVGATGLLIVLYGKPKPIVLGVAAIAGLGFAFDIEALVGVAGGLATVGLMALHLRSEMRIRLLGASVPVFSFIALLGGALASAAAAVLWLLPDGPIEPRAPLSLAGPLALLAGWLSWKYHAPAHRRGLRLALGTYVFIALGMTATGLVQHFAPDPAAPAVVSEQAAEIRAARAKQLAQLDHDKASEVVVFTTGSYLKTVEWRTSRFVEKAAGDAGFAVALVAMFLLGIWFVRSGVMDNTAAHLPFFRKLAFVALPLGIGLGLLGSAIAMSHLPGDRGDGWGIARGLLLLGNLPACAGYVGMVVLMLHAKGLPSRIRVLAAPGRMALTNYLLQSLVCALCFYGFGLGLWGISRSWQVVFVLLVSVAQIACSHWWLARFRHGPVEWVWRGFTYRKTPPLRIAPQPVAAAAGAS